MLRKGLQQPGHQRARVPSPFRSGARSAIGDVAGRKWMEVTPSPMTRTTEFHRGPALHQKKTFRCAAYLSVVLPFVPRLGIPLSMLLSAFALPGPPMVAHPAHPRFVVGKKQAEITLGIFDQQSLQGWWKELLQELMIWKPSTEPLLNLFYLQSTLQSSSLSFWIKQKVQHRISLRLF